MVRIDNIRNEALNCIGYSGNFSEFKESRSKELATIKEFKIDKTGYREILLANFIFRKDRGEGYREPLKKVTWTYKTSIKYVREFIKSQNDYLVKTSDRKLELASKIKLNAKNYYFYIRVLDTGQIAKKNHSNKSDKIIIGMIGIFISKENKEFYFISNTKTYLQQLKFNFMKGGIIFKDDYEKKEIPKEFFSEFFSDNNIEIFKIDLNSTEISIADKIVIYSKNGEGSKYYNKFKKTKIIDEKEFGIHDLGSVFFRYNKLNYRLSFNRKKDMTVDIRLMEGDKRLLPRYVQRIIDKEVRWTSKLSKRKILKLLIYKGYIDLYNKTYNRQLNLFLEDLDFKKYLKIVPEIRYTCETKGCEKVGKRFSSKKCTECKQYGKKRIAFYRVLLDYNKIISETGRSLKKKGFFTNYKKMRKKYLGLRESNQVLQILDKEKNFSYIIINQQGLDEKEIEKIKTYGIPLMIINFKGEFMF